MWVEEKEVGSVPEWDVAEGELWPACVDVAGTVREFDRADAVREEDVVEEEGKGGLTHSTADEASLR